MIQAKENGEPLTLYLTGQVDSSNSALTEQELTRGAQAADGRPLVIDCGELKYISSAGLRIILRLRKQHPDLKLTQVKPEVYDVFEMTGFTEMMTVEKAYRTLSVEGCEKLGEGSNGIVYRYDPEIVIKVYRNPDALEEIRRERELARKALILGIPTAIPFDVVKVGDRYASVFELLKAQSFSSLIRQEPEKLEEYTRLFTDLLKQIHATEVSPADMPDMKQVALRWADFLDGYLTAGQSRKLHRLIADVPERHTMIHGDYHTNNVVMQNGEVLLIDMDTLCFGHPVFELATMYLSFVGFGETDPVKVEKFLELPYGLAGRIWAKSLSLYLGTEDPETTAAVSRKAQVVGYTRLLRRTVRREADTEHGRAQAKFCRKRLGELLEQVDSLIW